MSTLIVLALVGLALFAALRAILRGKGRCGVTCGSCPHAGHCRRPDGGQDK